MQHLFIPQILIAHLYCARSCSRHWGSLTNRVPALTEFTLKYMWSGGWGRRRGTTDNSPHVTQEVSSTKGENKGPSVVWRWVCSSLWVWGRRLPGKEAFDWRSEGCGRVLQTPTEEYYRQREMASPKALRQQSASRVWSTQRNPVRLEWSEQVRAWRQLKMPRGASQEGDFTVHEIGSRWRVSRRVPWSDLHFNN